jgi:hypothetical protein
MLGSQSEAYSYILGATEDTKCISGFNGKPQTDGVWENIWTKVELNIRRLEKMRHILTLHQPLGSACSKRGRENECIDFRRESQKEGWDWEGVEVGKRWYIHPVLGRDCEINIRQLILSNCFANKNVSKVARGYNSWKRRFLCRPCREVRSCLTA